MSSAHGGSSAGVDTVEPVSESNRRAAVVVGKIAAPFGVRGWTKVVSYTEPQIGLLQYRNWKLAKGKSTQSVEVDDGREHGKFLVVKLKGIEDRDQVALLTNSEIAVAREEFPDTDEGDYYWADLIGLMVATTDGVRLGTVKRMMETGANDVMVVVGDRERLVPWVKPDVIVEVDLNNGQITVDWDPDF